MDMGKFSHLAPCQTVTYSLIIIRFFFFIRIIIIIRIIVLIDIKDCPTNLRSHFPARHGWRQVGRSAPAVKWSKRRMLWNVTVLDDVCPNTCQVSNCSIFLVGCCSPILVVPQNNPWPILSPPTGWPSWNPGPKLVDFAVPVFQKPHIDPTTLPDLPVRPKTKTIFCVPAATNQIKPQQKYTSRPQIELIWASYRAWSKSIEVHPGEVSRVGNPEIHPWVAFVN